MSSRGKNQALSLRAVEGPIVPETQCYQHRLREAMFDGVSASDVTDVVKSIVAAAKKGDAKAQSILLTHIVGTSQKPQPISVTIECPDVGAAVKAAQALRQRGARESGE
jgi:hypothetical protein